MTNLYYTIAAVTLSLTCVRAVPTCAPGSVAEKLPFCDVSKTLEERAQVLADIMTVEEKLDVWHGHGLQLGVPRLNVKQYFRDTVCFQGVGLNVWESYWPAPFVTAFPNAINWGASFDDDLVAQAANATSSELRGVNEIAMQNADAMAGTVCDVGPMANTAHDPRWGRIAQIYSEDPFLAGSMTRNVVQNLQRSVTRNGQQYLKSAVTIGLFIGSHSTNLMPTTEDHFVISARDMNDQFLPAYGQAMTGPEQAEGIMCSHAALNSTACCASHYLLDDVLRKEWGSKALVRTDCCHELDNMVTYHNVTSIEQAVHDAVTAGLQYCFGCSNDTIDAYKTLIAQGNLSVSTLNDAVARGFLSRFRLGEFDADPASAPYGRGYASTLDSAPHRKLAADLAAASVVLMRNDVNLLPLSALPQQGMESVVVVGEFAHCTDLFRNETKRKGWGNPNCYMHDYEGNASAVTTLFEGLQAAAPNLHISYESDQAAAIALAAHSDITIAALGLGQDFETESHDRSDLLLPDQKFFDDLAAVSKKLVLVLFTAGPIDTSNLTAANATLWAGYPGEEAGTAIASVMFGSTNPSGRLPMTWYKNDYLNHVGPVPDYSTTSGVGRTYRYIKDLSLVNYWFGYGKSYTSFSYAEPSAKLSSDKAIITFSVKVTNTGNVSGHEVVQIYFSFPDTQPQDFPRGRINLCGYKKVFVNAGSSMTVSITTSVAQLELVHLDGSSVLPSDGNFTVYFGGNQPGDPHGSPGAQMDLPASVLKL